MQVQSVVDLIAGLIKARTEDVAIVFQGKRLDNHKVMHVMMLGFLGFSNLFVHESSQSDCR